MEPTGGWLRPAAMVGVAALVAVQAWHMPIGWTHGYPGFPFYSYLGTAVVVTVVGIAATVLHGLLGRWHMALLTGFALAAIAVGRELFHWGPVWSWEVCLMVVSWGLLLAPVMRFVPSPWSRRCAVAAWAAIVLMVALDIHRYVTRFGESPLPGILIGVAVGTPLVLLTVWVEGDVRRRWGIPA